MVNIQLQIISEWWALTAAHCVEFNPLETLNFLAGATNKSGDGFVAKAAELIIHPDFNPSTFEFDVAVVKVEQPFQMGQNSFPIRLITQYTDLAAGLPVVTSGWGFTVGSASL